MPGKPTLSVRDNRAESRFEARDETGAIAGVSAYHRPDGEDGGRVVFVHTEVSGAFEGQGVGSVLVRASLDAVREEGAQVVAQCPFVRSWIDRHPEYADLIE